MRHVRRRRDDRTPAQRWCWFCLYRSSGGTRGARSGGGGRRLVLLDGEGARAREELIDKLQALGVTDVQRIELRGPIGTTRPHPNLHPGHQVPRVGGEIVDVTWMQIDTAAATPWKVYASIEALRDDWTEVRDWTTDALVGW